MNELIPLPTMSEYLTEEFMKPLNIDPQALSDGTGIALPVIHALLRDETEITPELSARIGSFFGVSEGLFLRLQTAIKSRRFEHELQYA